MDAPSSSSTNKALPTLDRTVWRSNTRKRTKTAGSGTVVRPPSGEVLASKSASPVVNGLAVGGFSCRCNEPDPIVEELDVFDKGALRI
jgi:hypothetical protein